MDNKEENIIDFSNMSREDSFWWILLFYLLEERLYESDIEWKKFVIEITYNNRFFPDNKFIKEIEEKLDKATYIMKEGTVFYRARIFNENPYLTYLNLLKKHEGITDKEIESISNLILVHPSFMDTILATPNENDENFRKIAEVYNRWKKINYKGYDADQSLPPPKEKVPIGRANPEFVRYLYLSEDEETPVYEVRPIVGQHVSVAKFKTRRDLKIFDLTNISSHEEILGNSLLETISNHFSMPYNGNPIEYLPTQYIAEFIKKKGFDGIRFSSSLKKDGKNLVLFDVDSCKVISSYLTKVDSINLNLTKPAMYAAMENVRTDMEKR